MSRPPLDDKALTALGQKFDPEMRFRPLAAPASIVVGVLLVLLSAFHDYTAGFGLLQEVAHRGVPPGVCAGADLLDVCAPRGLAASHATAPPGHTGRCAVV